MEEANGLRTGGSIGAVGDRWTEFVALYTRTCPDVSRYLNRATAGDVSQTEDLTQEVFMAALQEFMNGRSHVVTNPWLITVARNRVVDFYRRQQVQERKLALVAGSVDDVADADDLPLDRHEAVAVLRSLPPLQRLVLVLRYVDDLPIDDVARHVGKSVPATESLLARARAAFRAHVPGSGHAH